MQHLAPELVVHIFESLTSISDIISLSLTCRYFHKLLTKSQKLVLFFSAIEKEMGPLDEILQLLTMNQNQILHLRRTPPLSYALLSQVTTVGRVAHRFVSLYPAYRWTEAESASRRLLDQCEARRLRRAVYRFWSYALAFHSKSYSLLRPDTTAAEERLQLLRSWTNDELFELEDLRCTFEQLLASEICPTDGEVYSRIPEDARQSQRSMHHRLLPHLVGRMSTYQDVFHSSREPSVQDWNKASPQELRYKHMQGWGSDLQNFYLVQSFLKFSPAQLLWLFDNAITKAEVEQFIESQTHDPCFFESGSLLFHDWVTVLHARNVDVQQAREAIWDGKGGIVIEL